MTDPSVSRGAGASMEPIRASAVRPAVAAGLFYGVGAPRKLFKIGEVMSHTGLSRQTIHNYSTMGLINEAERTPSGHRLYDEGVFELLARIERLKRHHTLQEVREILEEERRGDIEVVAGSPLLSQRSIREA